MLILGGNLMDKKLITDIIAYVEETEVNNDAEWGMGRSLEQMLSDDVDKDSDDAYFPEFYFKLKDMLNG